MMGEGSSLREPFPLIELAFYARCCCLAGDLFGEFYAKPGPTFAHNALNGAKRQKIGLPNLAMARKTSAFISER